MKVAHSALLVLSALAVAAPGVSQTPVANVNPPPHGFFTGLPKLFGRLEKVDAQKGEIHFVLERDGQSLGRPLRADVDVFVVGGLGSPGDLQSDERIWIVFDTGPDRKELKAARFITDEIGLQTIHGDWFTVESVDGGCKSMVVSLPGKNGPALQTLSFAENLQTHRGARRGGAELLHVGDRVRYQTRLEQGQYRAIRTYDAAALDRHSALQRLRTEQRLRREGVPGEIATAGPEGDITLLLYRPGGDEARNLKPGDEVRTKIGTTSNLATVIRVQPWGEKTRLQVRAPSVGTPAIVGQAIHAFVPRTVRIGSLPPGVGRATDRTERIEWLLSSVYCTCPNRPDTCTGHLYTLSMCDTKGCGMPDAVRAKLGAWIDAGKTDAELLDLLEKEQGELLRRIHLAK